MSASQHHPSSPPSGSLGEFARRVAVGTAIVAGICVLLLGAWYGRELILLVFAGLLIAIYLRGLSHLFSRYTRVPCHWSIWIVTFCLLILVGGALTWLAPHLVHQISALADDLEASLEQIRSYVSENAVAEDIFDWALGKTSALPKPANVMSVSRSLFSSAVGIVASIVLVAFIAVYLALRPESYRSRLIHYVPPAARERAEHILDAVIDTLRWWLIGKSVSIVVVGVLTWVGLTILGVKLALTLAVLAGMLAFVPNFGPIISVVPAALVALAQRPTLVLWVLGLYIVIQTLESYIITPVIQRRAVSLPAVVIILGQVALGMISGALGLALATPLIAVLHVLGQELYLRSLLGVDPDAEVPT